MIDVSQFIDSPEMREHLRTVQLSKRTCEELVCGSPKPLAEKLVWLEQQGSACAEEVRRALEGLKLKPGEFIYLTEKWYDSDFIWWNQSSGVPFSSLDAAARYIRRKMAEEEWDEDSLCWTQLGKWVLGKDSFYHQSYTYYLLRDEIVYFENYPTGRRDPFCGAPDLNVPILFQPGDIVTIDCRPFMPIKPVALLEVDDYCCGVTCLFRREEDGKWEVGSVKHSRCWAGFREFPVISPLYRLAAFRGELGKDERLLGEVSKYIDGDVEKGQDLWENLNQEMNRLDRQWLEEREVIELLRDDIYTYMTYLRYR